MILYWSKARDDARRVTTVLDEKSLAEFLYSYFVEHYALTHVADIQVRSHEASFTNGGDNMCNRLCN